MNCLFIGGPLHNQQVYIAEPGEPYNAQRFGGLTSEGIQMEPVVYNFFSPIKIPQAEPLGIYICPEVSNGMAMCWLEVEFGEYLAKSEK